MRKSKSELLRFSAVIAASVETMSFDGTYISPKAPATMVTRNNTPATLTYVCNEACTSWRCSLACGIAVMIVPPHLLRVCSGASCMRVAPAYRLIDRRREALEHLAWGERFPRSRPSVEGSRSAQLRLQSHTRYPG